MPDAAEDRAVNRFLSGRTLVSALLLADLVAGTAVVIARATTSTDRPAPVRSTPAAPTTTTTMAVPAAGGGSEGGPGRAGFPPPVPDRKSATRPSRFEISEFRFHPAGRPECAS